MEWMDDLEKDAWNTIIDELVWHVRNGRMPSALARTQAPDSGVEFQFPRTPTVFLPVDAHALATHWEQAVEIIGRFTQLDALRFRC
jgi:hypothetical protein